MSAHGGAAGAESRLNFLFNALNSLNAASNIAVSISGRRRYSQANTASW